MKCPCPEQQDIPDGSKFCGHCGQSIASRQSTTASFETASEGPFQGGGEGTAAGPALVDATIPEEAAAELQAAAEAAAAEDEATSAEADLQATMAMDALPLQPTVDEAAEEPADTAQGPAAKPSTIEIDASLSEASQTSEHRPTPTELAKAVEDKPTEEEPAADTEEEPAADTAQEPAAAEEPPAKSEKGASRKQKKKDKKRTLQPPPDGAAAKKAEEPKEPEPTGEKRGFRETMWFMDALDQDALSAIETEDIRDRQDKFKDDGREIEIGKDVRRQFSLRAGEEEAAPGKTMMKMARQKFDTAQSEASSAGGGGATIAIVVGIVAALGAAAYFLFLK